MIKSEVEQAIQNWALWRGSGGWFYVRCSADVSMDRPAVRVDTTPHTRETTVPVLGGLASDVDDIIATMRVEWAQALRAYYLAVAPDGERISLLTMEQTSARLACSLATYKRRLEEGRQGVGDGLDGLRWRMEEAREKYRRMAA